MADGGPVAHSPTLMASGAGEPARVEAAGPEPERLVEGTQVGEYLVDGFLGAGAMGEVYAGTHPVIGKKVAIKVLRRDLAASRDGAERFTREARAVNQIDHPNVIDIFSFGRLDDGRLYLVMDLVEGRSLRRALATGPLEVDAALHVLEAIASALDAAHARGVVHRDLKPDNVMLGPGAPPAVFVLDFGLAKLVAADADAAPPALVTGQGTWLGTPAYMAPEQWSAAGAGPASDRYALGVMAFELLSGRLPFQAPSLPALMEQHFRADVPTLVSRGADPSRAVFDPVLARALAKPPGARFGSARELVAALRAAAHAPRHPRALRRGPAAAALAVLGLALVAVVVARGGRARSASAARASAAAPIAGLVRVTLLSLPAGAEVHRDGRLVGVTPTVIDLPPGATLAFDVRMPGYAPIQRELTVPARDVTLPVAELVAIDGFEGVWALPNGELRAFERVRRPEGERVEVSKLTSVEGERTFYRHYTLVPSTSGVAFASTEVVIEPAAPNEPSCHLPHRVEYHYEPAADTLTVRQEKVRHDLVHGRCIIKSAAFAPAIALVRADRRSSTERETVAPLGKPLSPGKAPPPGKPEARTRKDREPKALEPADADVPAQAPSPAERSRRLPSKNAPVESAPPPPPPQSKRKVSKGNVIPTNEPDPAGPVRK